MTRGSARLAALVVSLLAALLVLPGTAHATPGPLRIMLEGDSITQGFNGDFTWRYRFAKELQRQGVSFDLVGPYTSPNVRPGFRSATYADPAFDRDHFGLGGSTLAWHASVVGAQVTRFHPDVVVLEAGLNDLREGTTPQQLGSTLSLWIDRVQAAAPDATIVVSSVLDATDFARPWLLQRIRDFRAVQQSVVAAASTDTSRVVLSDTNRGWSVPTMTVDNVHPTATGETLIAQRIAEAFQGLGLLPSAPQVYRPTAWTWRAATRVRQSGRSIRVTWDRESLSGARVWIRRVGGRAKVVTLSNSGSYVTGAVARGARYDVRTQFFRGRATTTWGPTIRVKVRRATRPAPVKQAVIDAAGVHWAESPSATHYVVKLRTAGSKRWKTRRTDTTQVYAARVTQAKVKAVNSAGSSAYRTARR